MCVEEISIFSHFAITSRLCRHVKICDITYLLDFFCYICLLVSVVEGVGGDTLLLLQFQLLASRGQ